MTPIANMNDARTYQPAAGTRRAARLVVAASCLVLSAACLGDWPTNRGSNQRTGNLDDLPGPKTPKVLWVFKAQEHFVASPVPVGKSLFASGLGAFNTAQFHCLSLEDDPPKRMLWGKSAPFLKLPVVCPPAVVDGLMVFGDGMHQTDGAVLYCLQTDTGRPVWQYPLPGKLVHLEGAPAIDKARVFIGGGDAGILCVDLKRMTLDGKEMDLPTIQGIIEKRWRELQDKYEQDKQKDPQFAIPPSEDALPKPAPRLIWQKGQGKWHVDAALAVVGERVLAASAYIDDEKVGKRCLLCLNAADGSTVWETPLKVNPWAGPTLSGNTIIVGCSSIRFDRKLIKGAQGEIVVLDLDSGQIKWRKDAPGGVLSPVAVKGDLVVFTATDGFVRAWSLADGQEKWAYNAGQPFFAAPAVAGGVVYAADLKAGLHAVGLLDGKPQWKMDVAADPAAQCPGMVFGSPVVHAGNIYLATCNLEGDTADQPCMVACLSDKAGSAGSAGPNFAIDKAKRTITIPAKVALRKLPTLQEIYPLEVAATLPPPQGQKAHETVVTFEARPSDVHKALLDMGLKPGAPARGDGAPSGPEVKLSLEVQGIDGKPRLLPLDRAMIDRRTGKSLPALKWHFTGSAMRQPDPAKDLKVYAADLGGTLVTIYPVTDETVFQSDLTMKECALLKLETNKNVLPEEGTPVKLVIEVK